MNNAQKDRFQTAAHALLQGKSAKKFRWLAYNECKTQAQIVREALTEYLSKYPDPPTNYSSNR